MCLGVFTHKYEEKKTVNKKETMSAAPVFCCVRPIFLVALGSEMGHEVGSTHLWKPCPRNDHRTENWWGSGRGKAGCWAVGIPLDP